MTGMDQYLRGLDAGWSAAIDYLERNYDFMTDDGGGDCDSPAVDARKAGAEMTAHMRGLGRSAPKESTHG